jgi:hypothetical protein
MCEAEADTCPPGCVLLNETGCQGCEPANVSTSQPQPKPRKPERSAAAKAEPQLIARLRILVEHVMAGVKRGRIGPEVWRHTNAHCDDLVMEIACGVHNFRATLRYNT